MISKVLIGIVLLSLLGSIAYAIIANRLLATSGGILVVSSRPKAEDALLILHDGRSGKLKYARADAPLGKQLASDFPATKDDPIRFYGMDGNQVKSSLDVAAGEAKMRELVRLERDSKTFPTPLLIAGLGAALGLLFPLKPKVLSGLMGAGVLLACTKLLTTCPTCPSPNYLGVDLAVFGVIGFGVLLVLSLRPSVLRYQIIAVAMAGMVVWQVDAWWRYQLVCVPCSLIGLVATLAMVLAIQWTEDSPEPPPGRDLLVGSLPTVGLATGFLIYSLATTTAPAEAPAKSLAAFGFAKEIQIKSLEELGLDPAAAAPIVVVEADGCEPCHQMLDFLDAQELKRVDYYFVNGSKPDDRREWRELPRPEMISGTPTIFLKSIDKVGGVDVYNGFSPDADWLKALAERLAAAEGGNNEQS
ncbi:MAG: hypothetical protein ACK4NQ_05795 [Fimbriimonadaceae bacterium]